RGRVRVLRARGSEGEMVQQGGGGRAFGPVGRVVVWLVVAALLLPAWLRPGIVGARADALLDGDPDAPIYVPATNQSVPPATEVNVELGSFTDPSGGGPWAVVVDWGDQTSTSTVQMPIADNIGALAHRWAYGGTYQVTVKVTDSFGASDSGGFLVTVGSTMPDVPTKVAATPGNASATVTWEPPFTDGGSPIDSYMVGIQPTAGGAAQTRQITELGALATTFSGLANGTQYTASVTAHNALGDGAATTTTVTPEAPILAITALGTTTLPEGSGEFDLTVTGTGFAEGMAVRWNGDDRQTVFVSATELTAQIAAADVANSGSASVTVHDGVGEATSNAVTITITNVAPSATFAAPASVGAGVAFTLALTDTTDPSSDDTTAGFTLPSTGGSAAAATARSGRVSMASCPTSATGQRAVAGKVRDQDGGEREYTATVQVVALPAAVLVVAAADGLFNGTAVLSATLTLMVNRWWARRCMFWRCRHGGGERDDR
ncbi:MAG: fibronectin type III domain-containing protein, partial [Chloroflexia bacterium]